ncbi:hypothetical protein D3C76_1788160 [compost metagenome]
MKLLRTLAEGCVQIHVLLHQANAFGFQVGYVANSLAGQRRADLFDSLALCGAVQFGLVGLDLATKTST